MAEQITTMVVNVDLGCSKCYKKVKKALCKFPEIQDQVYDVKQNTVAIKVVRCCPEKIKEKISSKGGKSIKSIEIKPPEKPKPKVTEQKKKEPEEKKKEPEKTNHPPKSPLAPPKTTPEPAVLGFPPITVYPIPFWFGACCRECYEGHGGGPCQQLAYGRPPCYDGYYGRPVYDSWGGGCTII